MGKEFHRCVGLELNGTKSRRTSIAVLDHYPGTGRLMLSDVHESLNDDDKAELSPDEALVAKLTEIKKEASKFAGLSIHGPLSFPSMLDLAHSKKQPLGQLSRDPEARWIFDLWQKLDPQPRPFVPYLQRPSELWLRYCTAERFLVNEAFGANAAPLAARLRVLTPYLPKPIFESLPRATLTRLVSSLGLSKWLSSSYSDLEDGLKTREEFIHQLLKKLPQIFVYNRDHDALVTHLSCFNAFLSAINQFLIHKQYCENPPRSFPKNAAWIPIPRTVIPWEKIFK